MHMWSFVMPHADSNKLLEDFRAPPTYVEVMAGINLLEELVGTKNEKEKGRKRAMWPH